MFLSRLIFDGTFDKFPNLKVCGAHAGGYLPSYLGRTEVACQRNGQQCIIKRKPSDYMKTNILADSMVFSAEGVRHLISASDRAVAAAEAYRAALLRHDRRGVTRALAARAAAAADEAQAAGELGLRCVAVAP